MKDKAPEEFRTTSGPFASMTGMKGLFHIPYNDELFTVVSNVAPEDKEHISISLQHREPTDDELKHIMTFFFNEDEIADVVKVNFGARLHPYCIHLDKLKNVIEDGYKFKEF